MDASAFPQDREQTPIPPGTPRTPPRTLNYPGAARPHPGPGPLTRHTADEGDEGDKGKGRTLARVRSGRALVTLTRSGRGPRQPPSPAASPRPRPGQLWIQDPCPWLPVPSMQH